MEQSTLVLPQIKVLFGHLLQRLQQTQPIQSAPPAYSEEEILKIFDSAEKVERTPRGSKPQQNTNDGKKKKKDKK